MNLKYLETEKTLLNDFLNVRDVFDLSSFLDESFLSYKKIYFYVLKQNNQEKKL